jgi:hypothetical protein
MVSRIQHLTTTTDTALNVHLLSVQLGVNRHRVDPAQQFCVGISRNADPFEVALQLEILAGSIRAAARGGVLR